MKRTTAWTLLTAILVCSGCAGINGEWKKKLPWSAESKIRSSKYETPTHLIAIWSPDVVSQPGKPPTRGFGGRIYFYNAKNQAVPVEGQLLVYAYDDANQQHQPGQPERKFAFTPDQLTKHYSSSDLGASYSIWIPWDAVGGEQRQISLVPVFTATSGQVVMGQLALNVLPGRGPEKGSPENGTWEQPQVASLMQSQEPMAPAATDSGSMRVATVSHAAEVATRPPQLRTATIHLPPSLQKRMATQAAGGDVSRTHPEVPVPAARPELASPAASPVMASPPAAIVPQTEWAALPAAPQEQPGWGRPSGYSAPAKFPVRGGLGGRSGPLAPWTPPYPATPPSALPRSS